MTGSNSVSTDRATWWQAALMIRGQTETDQRNIRAVWVWSFIFGAGFTAAVMALTRVPELAGPIAWLVAAVPSVLGIGLLRSCLRFIREADEFMRKIHLEGIAIGAGAASIFCLGYFAFTRGGAPELPMLFALIPLTSGWALGSFIVAYRHR
jgi:hypothetical protein